MFLRRLTLANFAIFHDAAFDLATTVDRPIVLITGNNGAGKTSLLEAIRLALHGRRAFDVPLGEVEYMRMMDSRFHAGDRTRTCSVNLEFDYADQHTTRHVVVERAWSMRRQRLAEEVQVSLDGKTMSIDDADDLLSSIVPPEIARYFFFDGERIRELAEWEVEDESALFRAVGDLLGLGVLEQLRIDLLRIAASEDRNVKEVRGLSTALDETRAAAMSVASELRVAKARLRKTRGAFDRARNAVRQMGVLLQSELAEAQTTRAKLIAEKRSLHEEVERAAADVLPLLCARTLRSRFGKEMGARRRLEDRETVNAFIEEHRVTISAALVAEGFKKADARCALEAFGRVARGRPLPVNATLPNLSRSDTIWMQRVIERELPELRERMRAICDRMRAVEAETVTIEERIHRAPKDDPAGETTLQELEERQREHLEQETSVADLERRVAEANAALSAAEDMAKAERFASFSTGRLRLREKLINLTLEALPALGERLQSSKEQRFGRYLADALRELWHKEERLLDVSVSFSERRIALFDAFGEIRKRDLSAGEKQLFAIAFIYALARLSSRQMPFVIDTPLGRLDREHRRRLVAGFLPSASHQVILLSTDTEIVGPLYDELRPLIASHHELADQNGGTTAAVELALA